MRVLGAQKNELKVLDRLSETTVTLYYDMPTTKDRMNYSNALVKRIGKKVKIELSTVRLKYGLKLLTGFAENDFGQEVDGVTVAISSDPNMEFFLPDWKEYLQKYASDIVEYFSAAVFEASVSAADETGMENDGGDEDDEDISKN
jgi:hypothetical protein